jgi:hypothetical protein
MGGDMRDRKDLIGDPVDPNMPVRYEPDEGDGGHPLVATIVGVVFLLLMAASSRESGASGLQGQAEKLIYLATSAVVGAAIVWGIAYAITIRKASTGWKIGSLIAIAIASLLSTAIRMSHRGAYLDDAMAVSNQIQEVARTGKADGLKLDEGGGPMSRMTAAMLKPLLADSAAYQQEMQAAGLVEVVGLEGLTRTSPVLDHCDALDRLADQAKHYGSRWQDHMAAAVAIGREAVRAGEMPAEALRGFESGARETGGKTARQWELSGLTATEAAAICRVLARRNWDMKGNMAEFRNGADLAEFNRHGARYEAYAAESERIRAGSKAALEQWAKEGKTP